MFTGVRFSPGIAALIILLLLIYDLWKVPMKSLGTAESSKKIEVLC